MDQDSEQLRLLSIFHYVVGGLMALFACVPVIHLGVGLFMIFAAPNHRHSEGPAPAFVGIMFVLIAAIFIILGWALAILTFWAGRSLSQRRRYTFCFVVACILCAFAPFGTVLGVFTIIVLMRPSVKKLFGYPVASV